MLKSTQRRKLLAVNSAADNYRLSAGETTIAAIKTALGDDFNLVELGREGDRFRGIRMQFAGSHATAPDGKTGAWRVYGVLRGPGGDATIHLLGTASITLSTDAGGGTLVGADERYADTISWTEAGALTAERAMVGGDAAVTYDLNNNGNANEAGWLGIPDLGNYDALVFDPNKDTADGLNMVYQLTS